MRSEASHAPCARQGCISWMNDRGPLFLINKQSAADAIIMITEIQMTPELLSQHNLTEEEYQRIVELPGKTTQSH